MAKKKLNINSILIVDDNQAALELYGELLRSKVSASVVTTKFPSSAIKMAMRQFFDIIMIDATMTYRGTQFGGLDVYRSLVSRYGDSSLIVYSQFITDDLLKEFEYELNFLEKGDNPITFIDKSIILMSSLRNNQSCFIAMPFDSRYDTVFRVIKECIESASYRCIRIDKQHFTKPIVEKIFAEIGRSKFLTFLSSDQNPNAFYECGYAVAQSKEVITLTDIFQNLPFDIRDRNAIAFGSDLILLKHSLREKLHNLTKIT